MTDEAPMSRWTDEELLELVTLWPTNSAKQIAKRMHRPRSAICSKAKWLRAEGVLPHGVHEHFDVVPVKARLRHAKSLWTDEETRKLMTLWPTNSTKEIAKRLRRPRASVCGKVHRLRQQRMLPTDTTKHLEQHRSDHHQHQRESK